LWGNIEKADEINQNRLNSWNSYYHGLKSLEINGYIELPIIPKNSIQNAHMFYIKVKDIQERTELIEYLKQQDINVVFHYVPLHSTPAGLKFGRFNGEDIYTTTESEKLIRLPMYYGLLKEDINYVVATIYKYYGL